MEVMEVMEVMGVMGRMQKNAEDHSPALSGTLHREYLARWPV